MRVPLTESVLGWATAMGEVLVIVVIVAAGSIRVDMSTWRINLSFHRSVLPNNSILQYVVKFSSFRKILKANYVF